jgi:vacuolar-type H+-ATPase subunit I/STV1
MKKVIAGLMIMAMVSVTVVWAADEGQAAKEKKALETPKQMPSRGPVMPMREQMRGRGPGMPGAGGMSQAYEEFSKKRAAEHNKAIAELEEIKKIAGSEKATKTVEALQKMIDNKNIEFKKSVEAAEKQRAEMQERAQQRQQQMAAQEAENAKNKPVKPEDKAKTPVEKADK